MILNDFDVGGREGHHESADPGAPRRCQISEEGGGNQRTIDLKGQPTSAEDRPLLLHCFIYTGSFPFCQ